MESRKLALEFLLTAILFSVVFYGVGRGVQIKENNKEEEKPTVIVEEVVLPSKKPYVVYKVIERPLTSYTYEEIEHALQQKIEENKQLMYKAQG